MVWREGHPPATGTRKEEGGRGVSEKKERRMITSHNNTALYSLNTFTFIIWVTLHNYMNGTQPHLTDDKTEAQKD